MSKLLNQSLKKFMIYAGFVLACSIPVYYLILNRLWHYELDEHKIVLTTAAGKEDRYLIVAVVTFVTVLFFILLMEGLIFLNRRISQKLWQPFYNSLDKIKKFELEQQEAVDFDTSDIDEFSELNHSLHKLIESNIAVYRQQKEFADNASHELQTPLAIIQSKLDLLLQSRSLTDEQYLIIEEANKALARVTRINRNLLLLAKLENSQYMEQELVDLSDLMKNALPTLQPFLDSKTLHSAITPDIAVKGNKILIEIIFNNLMTNAIRYCTEGGTIDVALTNGKLTIGNSGSTPLRQENLFKRFVTTSQTPGTGLGLALAKQIVNRYRWTIGYDFKDGMHVFYVHF